MKLLQKDSQLLKIEFTIDELELLNRIIDVPISAFGLDKLLEKTELELDEIKLIKQNIQSTINNKTCVLSISPIEYSNLKNIFKIACEIVDPYEIHTLTGYSWEDVMKLQNALDMAL